VSGLASSRCKPLPPGTQALTRNEIEALLKDVPGWAYDGKVVVKTYAFKNYYETMAFVTATAWISHREDHHPDLLVGYSQCKVSYVTHAIKGLSENDFICAAKIDSLLEL
jgi:4a-hydroxytetrahydrobiopterin dehydratase